MGHLEDEISSLSIYKFTHKWSQLSSAVQTNEWTFSSASLVLSVPWHLKGMEFIWDVISHHPRLAVLKIQSSSCCSVAKLCPTLWPHELQHARLPCPSLSPGVCSNSCPLSWWCHPTVSFSVTLFFCDQSSPPSRSFPASQLFTSGDGSIRASASASTLPVNIQDCFSLGLLVGPPWGPKDSQESSPEQFIWSISSLVLSLLYGSTLTCVSDYWKNSSFDCFCQQNKF